MQQKSPQRLPGTAREQVSTPTGWHPRPPAGPAPEAVIAKALKRRPERLWQLLVAIVVTLGAVPADANGSAGAPQAGTLLLVTGETARPATLLDTDVSITVNGLVARVSVMQHFRNTGSEWVEGTYVFPLPDTAAVDRMRLYIGDRFIEGEVREKEAAKQAYERAKQAGKKASLVEQQRANLFTTAVANIAPGETVIVEIEYLEEVRYDAGSFSLRFPLTITPRYAPGTGHEQAPAAAQMMGVAHTDAGVVAPPMALASASHRVSLTATINAGLPLALVTSRYHPVHVGEAGGRYAVTLAGGRAPMDRDFELVWRAAPASVPQALAFSEVVDGAPHFLLLFVPPEAGTAPPPIPREVIFVIDTSGSMHGQSLAQAKAALTMALSRLSPADRFNVIEFNHRARAVFPTSVAAGPVNRDVAKIFVESLVSNGGTEMYPALELALAMQDSGMAFRQLVFITDGAVSNEDQLFRLIDTRRGDTRLFTVGIGSAPNSWFMRKAAETGRGTFTMIGSLDEVGEKMAALFEKLERPQLTDIEIYWPGGAVVDSYPATVPDLYSGEPVAVRTRFEGGVRPGDAVRVVGNSLAGSWSADIALDTRYQGAGVAALWARARIGELMDARRRGGDADLLRAEVVATALEHHLVSPFTSLVAVDKTPVNLTGLAAKEEKIAALLPKGQSATAIFGLPGTATDAALLIRSGFLLLAAAAALALLTGAPRRLRRVRAA